MKQSLPEFIRCWRDSELSERAGAQSHFNDLCEILNEPHPAHADPKGSEYTFEKRVNKIGEDKGFADVWKRGFFGWEYKGPHKDLKAAYEQLLKYREDLENPPLLLVSDYVRFEVHTNFTNTPPVVYRFTLDDLILTTPIPNSDLSALDILRAVFQEPEKLKPGALEVRVTQKAAEEFTKLKDNLRARHEDNEAVARFIMQLLFCLFADSVGLLPENLFRKAILEARQEPKKFVRRLRKLFAAMATGDDEFGITAIHHFNGGLFRVDEDTVLDLTHEDLGILRSASQLDWGRVEPAIFGTLFERILNEEKRAQLGAHYTSREDILLIVEPVVMAPLKRRWAEVKAGAEEIAAAMETASSGTRAKLRAQLEAKVLRLDGRAGRRAHSRPRLRQRKLSLRRAQAPARSVERGADLLRSTTIWPTSTARSARSSSMASRPTSTRTRWLRWWSGSATCNGAGTMPWASRRSPSCACSQTSSTATPSSSSMPTAAPSSTPQGPQASRHGPRSISSSAIRRFSAASCCGATWATRMWMPCSSSTRTACPPKPIW